MNRRRSRATTGGAAPFLIEHSQAVRQPWEVSARSDLTLNGNGFVALRGSYGRATAVSRVTVANDNNPFPISDVDARWWVGDSRCSCRGATGR